MNYESLDDLSRLYLFLHTVYTDGKNKVKASRAGEA